MADKKPTVLLVEDDMFLRELCVVKLQKANFEVEYAEDGTQGLEMLENNSYDVVLLDIMLPERDGFELLEEYKDRHGSLEGMVLIMLTNLSEREQVDRAMELGADDYIIKAHFSPSEIVEKTQEWLEKAKQDQKQKAEE
ncbi:MAG: response regulator [Parcubacteria group bacterium SW_4_49_11]|nr:MAG: response regulator [Parcubacteria group bacterium SW_4_49_11]